MTKTQELIEIVQNYSAHNYLPLPVVLNRGKDATVWDVEGKSYIDFLSCYSALNFGHSHPEVIKTLTEQAAELAVCSRAFHSDQLSYLVKELCEFANMECALPMNSGTEAVETALKMVRKWGYREKNIAPSEAKIIVMENNFHGRSITVVSFSSEEQYRDGFGPYTPGFEQVPFGDLEALTKAIDDKTVGVLMEPIQAEAGILLPPKGYLSGVRKLCSERGVLMMLDEIQTGLGRTGADFCFQHDAIQPDVLILGKSLGGGVLPLSATLASKSVMSVFNPGDHGSTFGGNPLACAVGRTAIRLLRDLKLSERSQKLGKQVMQKLTAKQLPIVEEIRGKGLLIGIELKASVGGARKYCEQLAGMGLLCKETHEHVIRIAPPLTIDETLLHQGVDKILEVLR